MKCPLCNSENIVYDNIHDEFYCGVCGYVFKQGEVDIDIRHQVAKSNIPLGSYFDGRGKYRKLKKINNKNDINTYRLLMLQKIERYIKEQGLPITIYNWVVQNMKKYDKQWRFNLLVGLLYLGILEHGYYRELSDIANWFGLKLRSVRRGVHRMAEYFEINYRVSSKEILSFLLPNESLCVRCCAKYITNNVGNLALKYGTNPRIYALSIIFACRVYCGENVVLSRFLRNNNIPNYSVSQNIYRIFKEFGLEVSKPSLSKGFIKQNMEVIMNGSGCESKRVGENSYS